MIDSNYTPAKIIFTDADLENLCFHDCRIFASAPEGNDLLMDIDYMFEWYEPKEGDTGFTHPISPCTLHFKNVEDFGMSFEGSYPDTALIMQDFEKEENKFFKDQQKKPKRNNMVTDRTRRNERGNTNLHRADLRL